MAKGFKTGGRAKGTPNKTTSALRDMILGALEEKGGQKYLVEQAGANPVAFMSLLAKVLPTTLQGGDDDAPPIKIDASLSPEDAYKRMIGQ